MLASVLQPLARRKTGGSRPAFLPRTDRSGKPRGRRLPSDTRDYDARFARRAINFKFEYAEATRSDAREVREDEALCVCCLDRPRDIVFLSCMHVVVCEQCAPRTASCPTCRVPITEKRRIFR